MNTIMDIRTGGVAEMGHIEDLQIEHAKSEDWVEIAELQDDLFPNDPTQMDREEFKGLVAGDGGCVLVARVNRCFAAYVVLRRKSFLPWDSIAFMAVDSRFRGRGLGGLMTEAAADAAQRLFLRLHVRSSNTAAQAVYRRHGFRVIGRRENNYENGEASLIMMCWNGLLASKRMERNQTRNAA